MGMHSGRSWQDVERLTQELGRAKRQLGQIIDELADAREQIPDSDQLSQSLRPTPPDQRRGLADSCIALQLALRDASRWAHEVAERTRGHRPPGADAA